MTILDYFIIAVVAALFVLALIAYKKKSRYACGQDGSCCGNCSGCCHKYDAVSNNHLQK